MNRTLLVCGLLGAIWAGGCGSTGSGTGGSDDRHVQATPGTLDSSGLEIAPYSGSAAKDPRWPGRLLSLAHVGVEATATCADEAGLEFVSGRGPLLAFVDTRLRGGISDVAMKLRDGVRRPVISVYAPAALSGEYSPSLDLTADVVEAALASAAGEQTPPPWIGRGLPVLLGPTVEGTLYRLALATDPVYVDEAGLSAAAGPELWSAVEAAMRLSTLRRIGRGDHAVARFVAARLASNSLDKSLRTVGVAGEAFLDAAAGADRRRFLDRLDRDPALEAAAVGRAALLDGDLDAAAAQASLSPARAATSPWSRADFDLLRAHVDLATKRDKAAADRLETLLSRPEELVRLRQARLLALRADRATGRSKAVAAGARSLARDYPNDPAVAQAVAQATPPPEPPPPPVTTTVPQKTSGESGKPARSAKTKSVAAPSRPRPSTPETSPPSRAAISQKKAPPPRGPRTTGPAATGAGTTPPHLRHPPKAKTPTAAPATVRPKPAVRPKPSPRRTPPTPTPGPQVVPPKPRPRPLPPPVPSRKRKKVFSNGASEPGRPDGSRAA